MTMPDQRRRTTTILQGVGLLASTGLLLTGCVSVTFGEGGDSAPPSTVSAGGEVIQPVAEDAAPARGQLDADQLAEVALPADGTFPGGAAAGRSDAVGHDAPFTMSLSLTGFTPEGRCRELFEQVNDFRAPATAAVSSTYELDPAASVVPGEAPTLQVLAATTPEAQDAMGVYGELAEACGTIQSDQGPEATASFARVGDLDAVTVTIAAPGMEQVLAVGGTSVGRNHVYLISAMLPAADAEAVLQAQVDRFDEVLAAAGVGEE